MTTDLKAQRISSYIIGFILVVGQIASMLRYGTINGESIGFGIGLVIAPLIAHFLIVKLDADHKENMRKLLRAGIIEAILVGVVLLV